MRLKLETKCRYLISEITLIRTDENHKTDHPKNNWICSSNQTIVSKHDGHNINVDIKGSKQDAKGSKQNTQTRLRLHMPQGGEP